MQRAVGHPNRGQQRHVALAVHCAYIQCTIGIRVQQQEPALPVRLVPHNIRASLYVGQIGCAHVYGVRAQQVRPVSVHGPRVLVARAPPQLGHAQEHVCVRVTARRLRHDGGTLPYTTHLLPPTTAHFKRHGKSCGVCNEIDMDSQIHAQPSSSSTTGAGQSSSWADRPLFNAYTLVFRARGRCPSTTCHLPWTTSTPEYSTYSCPCAVCTRSSAESYKARVRPPPPHMHPSYAALPTHLPKNFPLSIKAA